MSLQGTHIHFIGIGGIGMSAAAKFARSRGAIVTGSDIADSEIVESARRAGVTVVLGQDGTQVPEGVTRVVYTSAAPEENPERVVARERGIPEQSYFEFLGELSKEFSTLVVTGTHGKSTTTALLGLLLEAGGYDPTVIVGSRVPSFPEGNLRVGSGRFLVVEGCEYKANMLHLQPEAIVLTNIEADHLDYYRDLDHIRETFQTFIDQLSAKGLTVVNADDAQSALLKTGHAVSCSASGGKATYSAKNRRVESGTQSAQIYRTETEETLLGTITLSVPGTHNLANAISAMSLALELGVPFEVCAQALASFEGIWRRFERVGTINGAEVISDYGHHPTEIARTLEATREFFPDRRVVLCFQPHQHARTRMLLDEFTEPLSRADILIVSEIYDVAGRNASDGVSSQQIVERVQAQGGPNEVLYAKDLNDAQEQLEARIQPTDVVLVMGAGDIDSVARALV